MINGVESQAWCDQERDDGGWTAVIDPSNGIAPEITLEYVGAPRGGTLHAGVAVLFFLKSLLMYVQC